MSQAKEISRESAIEALNRLFVGRGLVNISFGTSFRLLFGHYNVAPGNRPSPPLEVVVDVLGAFWINDRGDWNRKIAEVPSSVVEPSEPVMAYELARLRWTEDSEVVGVTGDHERVVFTLKNQEAISFSMFSEDEFAFLAADDADERQSRLSICCDRGIFFGRGLELLSENA